MHKYTDSEIKEIQERETKSLAYLKDNNFNPAAVAQLVNLGTIDPKFQDIFGIKVQPYLADTTKYPEKVEAEIVSDNPDVNPTLRK